MPKTLCLRPLHTTVLLTAAVALLVSACSSGSGTPKKTVTITKANGDVTTAPSASAGGGTSSAPSASAGGGTSSASPAAEPANPVHMKLLDIGDGDVRGVGIPVIAIFSKKITDGKPLQEATTATVNGRSVKGAWYFEYSSAQKGYPIEAHFRTQDYWPAHSRIHVGIPTKGLSAGKGLAYDDSLTLDFSTGARHISTVDDASHTMTVISDGKKYGTFPVSLGRNKTPTKRGTKVIMEKGRDISMHGPGYFHKHVRFTQRLTYDGEYLHAAPWNTPAAGGNIGKADSSNGCTNLLPRDADRLYRFLSIGDVVEFPNASGGQMQVGDGYGDWNVDWGVWQTGGLVSTT